MTANKNAVFVKDLAKRMVVVTREFDAPLEQVWRAWTDSEILDQWWAPRPWKARTKSMDFREGGFWLYCMEGPDGTKSWARADYLKIIPHKNIIATDYFCDEDGNKNSSMPEMNWNNQFTATGDITKLEIEISFAKEEDIKTIIEMGFEEGFAAALRNLDELLVKDLEIS